MKTKIKYCTYFDEIIEFDIDEEDILSSNLKKSYLDYIENSYDDDVCIKKVVLFDELMFKYINDYNFYKYLQNIYKKEEFYILDYLEYLYTNYESFIKNKKTINSSWY